MLFTHTIRSWHDWGRVFQSIPAFTPLAREICRREGLPWAELTPLTPGTNGVFRCGEAVLKIFFPKESGLDPALDFSTELAAARQAASWGVPTPPVLAHGCLQDIHWAMGDLGYFPSYALGSAYGAQAVDDLRKTMDLDAQWAAGDLEPLKAALKARVWQWGCMKEPQWLVESLCGGKFDPHHFTEYLKKKYTELYEL